MRKNKKPHVFSQTAFEILHKDRENINSEKQTNRIPLTRNPTFLLSCTYVCEYSGIRCQPSGWGGNQPAHKHLLPHSLHGTYKVGQPKLRASLAISKNKHQPDTKAVTCIIHANFLFAWQPWYCTSFFSSARRAESEQGCWCFSTQTAKWRTLRNGKKALFINYRLEIAHTANFVVHSPWRLGKAPQTKLHLLIYLFFFLILLLPALT